MSAYTINEQAGTDSAGPLDQEARRICRAFHVYGAPLYRADANGVTKLRLPTRFVVAESQERGKFRLVVNQGDEVTASMTIDGETLYALTEVFTAFRREIADAKAAQALSDAANEKAQRANEAFDLLELRATLDKIREENLQLTGALQTAALEKMGIEVVKKEYAAGKNFRVDLLASSPGNPQGSAGQGPERRNKVEVARAIDDSGTIKDYRYDPPARTYAGVAEAREGGEGIGLGGLGGAVPSASDPGGS